MEKGKDVKHSAAAGSGLPLTKAPFSQEENREDRFHNALKELGSQLYNAAEYYENAFSTSDQKKMVVAGTKSYIREAIVAVVDHLGSVSSKIEQSLLSEILVKQNEQRIDCLKQRILACQQYVITLELSSMQLNIKFPQRHLRYLSPEAEVGKVARVLEDPSILSRPSIPSFTSNSKDMYMLEGAYPRKKPSYPKHVLIAVTETRTKVFSLRMR